MGDRTAVYITCRKTDAQKVCEIMIGSYAKDYGPDMETDVGPDAVQMEFSEMNYAACDQIQEMVKAKIVFHGYHCAGGNYGACVFACDGKELVECSTLHDIYGPAIEVYADGAMNDDQLKAGICYWKLLDRVKQLIGEAEPVS